ncbi:hypothetical protein [Agromyces tropicus]|uniref:hypothetical protein n=1 Tax=Agromyces tropicus TaxID=555371 RepID=UPI0031D0401E
MPEPALAAVSPSSRPMSADNAARLLEALSGQEIDASDPVVRRRIAEKVGRVRAGEVDLQKLWSWVRIRAPRLALSASASDLPDLLDDPRLARSGISDPRAGLAVSAVAEGYVAPADLDALIRDYLLVESDRPNVWLHASDVAPDDSGQVPIGFVIADLLDHAGPRELGQAESLLEQLRR